MQKHSIMSKTLYVDLLHYNTMDGEKYFNLDSSTVIKHFNSDIFNGLTDAKVKSQIEADGPNVLEQSKKISPFKIFFSQFNSFIIYILIFAVIISILAGAIVDAIVILIILFFNAILGFVQEYRAEKSIDALKKIAALKSKVLRNGKEIIIDAENIVRGDIIILEEGNRVPADARIIDAKLLTVSESSLTGESVPVRKSSNIVPGKDIPLSLQNNMLFSGTTIITGKARAIVTQTGMKSELGQIAKMLSSVDVEKTPLQKKLETLGKWLGVGTIIICIIIFFAEIVKEGLLSVLSNEGIIPFILASKEWFLTAVSLAVAVVPEGLPAIVTITLALGIKKMLSKKALIRKLPSIETLGETTVICTDKTGTITRNQMTVRQLFVNNINFDVSGDGYSFRGNIVNDNKLIPLTEEYKLLFDIACSCNDASYDKDKEEIQGDPTEAALLIATYKAKLNPNKIRTNFTRLDEIPFSSERKMMSVIVLDSDKSLKFSKAHKFIFSKGAPESILDACSFILLDGKKQVLTQQIRNDILHKNEEYGNSALRVLGFAYKEFTDNMHNSSYEKEMVFVGLQGMIDPPHKEVKSAIKECYDAGIRVIMITGDNGLTAKGIAKEVGLIGDVIEGIEFEKLSKNEQLKTLKTVSIFARVKPAHKMLIVELLKEQGEIVAMTGDGVNDAPAIKKANLGIAMGITGTDVSKESSDMILQDDNFATIVNAIKEGRGIYQNIKKFVMYLLAGNLSEVFIIFLAIVFGFPLPMTAIMILWMNLVTDGLPALALSVDPHEKDLMKRKPVKSTDSFVSKKLMIHLVILSLTITFGTLGLFMWGMNYYNGVEAGLYLSKIQTIVFTTVILLEFVILQVVRREYGQKFFSNKYLLYAMGFSILSQLIVIYTPMSFFFGTTMLSLIDWGMILSVCVLLFLVNAIYVGLKPAVFKSD